MMDVRHRNGGATAVAPPQLQQGGHMKLLRTNGNKLTMKSNPVPSLMIACCSGIVLAFVFIGVGVLNGNVSLTGRLPNSNNNELETKAQQKGQNAIRGMAEQLKDTTRLTKELESIRKQNVELQAQLQKVKSEKDTAVGDGTGGGDTKKLESRITRLLTNTDRMHDMIQLLSKRHLIEKYGIGPHYVEIIVSFDPQSNIADHTKVSNSEEDTATLWIEMAPIDDMPSTVFWFLEQVNATIFNGASFHRNAHHVVQGGPIGNFETKTGDVQQIMSKIKSTGLDSVPFQEYSPNFPHVKYTLGYAGRPGGPDFYVSTEDNTHNHGPGGQSSYEEASEADPCFAKVVPGYEYVVDRMHKSEVQTGGYMRMKQYVAIRSMRLVPLDQAQQLLKIK